MSLLNERVVQVMLLFKHLLVNRLSLATCPSKIILWKNCTDYPQISNSLYAYMPIFLIRKMTCISNPNFFVCSVRAEYWSFPINFLPYC